MVNTRLNDFPENNKIINKSQIGFSKNCKTACGSSFFLRFKKRKPIFACFIDFRKAYDSVWREGLYCSLN